MKAQNRSGTENTPILIPDLRKAHHVYIYRASNFKGFVTVKQDSIGKDLNIDWDYWGKSIYDFDGEAMKHPSVCSKKETAVRHPRTDSVYLLFILLIFNSDGLAINDQIEIKRIRTHLCTLITRTSSSYEKLILRDLNRTFPKLYFQQSINQQSLFNVVKAYSLHDPRLNRVIIYI
jgi:hypothetical protein